MAGKRSIYNPCTGRHGPDLLPAAEEKNASHAVLLHYRKAFDYVDHTVLVSKCKRYDLPHSIIRWSCAFLSDWSQRVRLSQELSDWDMLKGSVPQGSWLGLIIFIVFIHDLHPPCNIHKYMDDLPSQSVSRKGA